VLPFVAAPSTRLLLAGVRDEPVLLAQVEVDLLVGKVDALTGEGLPDLGGSPRGAMPFVGDRLELRFRQGRTLRATVGVETRHDTGSAPTQKELSEPAAGDAPAGGHLGEGIALPVVLGLTHEVGNPSIGQARHALGGWKGI
jgi:hypothetical protein